MTWENYVGRAGQLAVMSEFLLRGYNVAIPEVDEGDDVLVVSNRAESLWRVQVKTAICVQRGYGFSGQFAVPLRQIKEISRTRLHFVFALRCDRHWEFVILDKYQLRREHSRHNVGSRAGDGVVFYLAVRQSEVICSGRDWQPFRNQWATWPVILT
jgi:hypothetical protein